MPTKDDRILVIGAGLGGLATALALGRRGRRVHVLEQSAAIAAIGYGIQMGPNVFSVLHELGIGEAVLANSYRPDCLVMLDAYSAQELARVPLRSPDFRERFEGDYVAIHRADLHEIFLRACRAVDTISFDLSVAIERYEQTDEGVTAIAEDGRAIAGAALIAADGLRSAVRAQMHPDDRPCPIGYVAHRSIVPMDEAPDAARSPDVTMWVGSGFHIIYYPLRGATELNIVAVFKTASFAEKSDLDAYRAEVRQTYGDGHPHLMRVLDLMDLEKRWPIADRDPIRRWSDGRVVLLGDAAHATLQSLAQGAGMAIEDAGCLAALLGSEGTDYAAAFRRFERERLVRTARVQLVSRGLWSMYHAGGMEADVRTQEYREKTAEDFHRCLEWLWTPAAMPMADEVLPRHVGNGFGGQ